ncbi:MAG TPA: T9SS type A sorting domain-containing protein [Bacteroidales bacterium]|nr:T9SS type A sorting domain-containing protein [Bacteroidales bacterium]HPS17735.1 T9SS type A sorting domain-containing protein [Bacteroidales bacterium]
MKNFLNFLRIVFVVLGCLLTQNTQAQNTFQKYYGTNGEGRSVLQLPDGNYAVMGTMNGDFFVAKMDKWGNPMWHFTYGGSGTEQGMTMTLSTDGQYLFVGGITFTFISKGIDAAYVLKIDASNGTLIWSRSFYGDGTSMNSTECYSIEVTADGGCIATGMTFAFSTVYDALFVVKFDADGNLVTPILFGGNSDGPTYVTLKKTSDGGFIVCADWYNPSTSTDLLLLKLDANGNEVWAKTYGGTSLEFGIFVKETPDGGFIAVGYSESFSSTGRSIYAVRTNSVGDTLWTRSIGCNDKQSAGYSVDIAGNDFIIAGYNSGFYNLITKIDSNGNIIFSENIESTTGQWLYSVSKSSDGGYISTGQYNGSVYLVKADSTVEVCDGTDAGVSSTPVNTIVTNVTLPQINITPTMYSPATIVAAATILVNTICSSNSVPVALELYISGTTAPASGYGYIGDTLKLNYTYTDADNDSEGVSTFKWLVNSVVSGTGNTYIVQPSDLNKWIKFEVTPVAQTGELIGSTIASAVVHIISKPDTSGINEFQNSVISVFPNPATRLVNISIPNELRNKKIIIEFINAKGEIILNKEIVSAETDVTLNISQIPDGLYFIRLQNYLLKLSIQR